MEIRKEDLSLKHYTWQDDKTSSRLTVTPTRKFFDRNNGTHILWIVNWYATEHPGFRKQDIGALELLFAEKLPSDVLSEMSVCNWLANAR